MITKKRTNERTIDIGKFDPSDGRTRLNRRFLLSFFNMLCIRPADQHGSEGSGMTRWVYESDVFPDIVFKIERKAGEFQNVLEWEYWQQVKHTVFAKHFAPCEHISDDGRILIMKRTKEAKHSDYPARMPAFFTDFKRSNYGLYKGRLVCHDYGTCLLPTEGLVSRTKPAHWGDS